MRSREKIGLLRAEHLGKFWYPFSGTPMLVLVGHIQALSLLDYHYPRASLQPITLCLQNPPTLSLLGQGSTLQSLYT